MKRSMLVSFIVVLAAAIGCSSQLAKAAAPVAQDKDARADIAQALAYEKKGEWIKAIDAFKQAARHAPEFKEPIGRYLIARSENRDAELIGFKVAKTVEIAGEAQSYVEEAVGIDPDLLKDEDIAYSLYVVWFTGPEKFVELFPKSVRAPQALMLLAGDNDTGYTLTQKVAMLRRIVKEYPNSKEANEARQSLARLKPTNGTKTINAADWAFSGMERESKDISNAIDAFKQAAKLDPTLKKEIGSYLFKRGQGKDATLLGQSPPSRVSLIPRQNADAYYINAAFAINPQLKNDPNSLFFAATASFMSNNTSDEAAQADWARGFVRKFPKDPRSAQLMLSLSEYIPPYNAKGRKELRQVYRQIIQRFPASKEAKEARKRLAKLKKS